MKIEFTVKAYGKEMLIAISEDSKIEEIELVFKTILFFLEYPIQSIDD